MKTISSKTRRMIVFLLSLIMACSVFAVILPKTAEAVPGTIDYDQLPYRYLITVEWNVVNANPRDSNYFDLVVEEPDPDTDIYNPYRIAVYHQIDDAAADRGTHSKSFLSNGFPDGIYYHCFGRTANNSEWYITKITVMPLHPVAGYERKNYTVWEGKFGMLISNTQVGGSSNVMTMDFTVDDYTMDVLPGVGIYAMQTTVFNGKAHIEGITDMTIEGAANNDTVVVPTGTSTVSYNITPGIYYDQYGAEWPIQGLKFKALTNIAGDFISSERMTVNNNVLTLNNKANDYNDYDVSIVYQYGSANSKYKQEKTVKVKTFDYNVTFKDEDGSVLKTEAVNCKTSATPPTVPETRFKNGKIYSFSGWVGDDYTDITSGVQNRTVTASYNTVKYELNGSGTSTDPYIIDSGSDWTAFCEYCKHDAATGKYFKLTRDIHDITVMAGTSGHEFKGIFDGDGHSINVIYGSKKNPITYTNAAPFSYVRDATIKNLWTDGDIYTAAKYAGGLVGSEWGDVTIENCRVSVAIISSVNGDGTHGGIVGLNNKVSGKRLIIRGCVFDGQLIGRDTNKCGGFIGWRSGTADIYDSVFDMNKLPNVDNYIQDEGSAMFARNKVDTHNSYYLTVFGTDDANQWKYGYKIDSSWMVKAEFAGEPREYSVSGITAYGTDSITGLIYNNYMYAGFGENVSLKLSHTESTGTTFVGYAVNAGILSGDDTNGYTLVMPDENVKIGITTTDTKYTVTWKNHDGTVIYTDSVTYDTKPAYNYTTHSTPAKAPTAEYEYVFTGWSPAISAATANAEYTAQFDEVPRTYKVTWKNYDGAVIYEDSVSYNTTPAYNSADHGTPYREPTAAVEYTFSGWSPAISAVTGDKTYTAQYTETVRRYTITWKDEDGAVIETTSVAYGDTPSHTVPVKANDEKYTYTGRWDKELSAVTKEETYTAVYAKAPNPAHFSVSGDTYTIHDEIGWEIFCECLSDNDTYNRFSGKTVTLEKNIGSSAAPITMMAGSSGHDFCGKFDGCGKTLYVNITSDADHVYTAPFAYVTNVNGVAAEIKDLTVKGSVTSDKQYAGGLVGSFWGTLTVSSCTVDVTVNTSAKHGAGFISNVPKNVSVTLTDCVSSAVINSTVEGDGTHGGFIALQNTGASVKFRGCLFNGKLLSAGTKETTNCGGFVGYRSGGTLELTDCLYIPAKGEGEWAIGYGSSTFARGTYPTATNSYSIGQMQSVQGKRPYNVTAGEGVTSLSVSFIGDVKETYDNSGITAYNNGMLYGGQMLYGYNDKVELTLAYDASITNFDKYSVSAGSLDGNILTMANEPVTVSVKRKVGVTLSATVSPDGVGDISVSPDGDLYAGDTVTLVAPQNGNYNFLGWFCEDEKVSDDRTFAFVIESNTELQARYKAAGKGSVTVNCKNGAEYTLKNNSRDGDDIYVGDSITLTAKDGSKVLQWENASSKITGTGASVTFTVTGDMIMTLVYKTEGQEQAYIQFVSSSGQVISAGLYNSAGISSMTFPDVPSRIGYTFTKWVISGTANEATKDELIRRLSQKTITVKAEYEQNNAQYTVTVKYSGAIHADTSDTVRAGTGYTVSAPDIAGYVFRKWISGDGTKDLGYNKDYYFQVTGDVTLTAVYSDYSTAEAKPVIIMSAMTKTDANSTHKVCASATRSIPEAEGYTLVEHGILYSKEAGLDKTTFICGTSGVYKFISNTKSLNGVVNLSVKASDDVVVYMRGYMILEKNGTRTEYYTDDIVYGSYNSLPVT